jgi:hypothetical protein
MDSRLKERKKRLLQELSCILQELEEISAAQEMEEETVDSVVLCEHLCQPAEKNEQLEVPTTKEHGMHDYIEQWFQSVHSFQMLFSFNSFWKSLNQCYLLFMPG